jgi:pimeloyl-ACP methyl ester carboxylesterase
MPAQSASPRPRGRLIELDAYRSAHAVFEGPPENPDPLVVLEAGAFGFSADWAAVQEKLARLGMRSMAYDRAGLGFSPPGPEPRDSQAIVGDLERLLLNAGESGPFILCGHSMAGLHVRLFTTRNAHRIVGVVLVDATTPEAMESKLISGLVEQFATASRLAAWGAEAGLLGPFAGTSLADAIGLEGAAGIEKRWAFANPGHNHWAAREVTSWADSARQAREAGGFDPRLPVAVVLAGGANERVAFRSVRVAPAKASERGWIENVDGASHATMLNGAFGDAIIRGIQHVGSVVDA